MLQLIVYNKSVMLWELIDFSNNETTLIAQFDTYDQACMFYDQLALPN